MSTISKLALLDTRRAGKLLDGMAFVNEAVVAHLLVLWQIDGSGHVESLVRHD